MPFGSWTVCLYAPTNHRLTAAMAAGLVALAGAAPGAMAQSAGIKVGAILMEGQPAQRVSNV